MKAARVLLTALSLLALLASGGAQAAGLTRAQTLEDALAMAKGTARIIILDFATDN